MIGKKDLQEIILYKDGCTSTARGALITVGRSSYLLSTRAASSGIGIIAVTRDRFVIVLAKSSSKC